MVGLVVVSHSAALAAGVVELARQMGGGQVAIEAAGGMAEPEGAIGTDVELVRAAIERAGGPDGVLVLMDLGSALMSAEMAAEMIGAVSDVPVRLSEAPLVEGAVAAAARAGAGAPLDEVAEEARAALGMKSAQLGVEEEAPAAASAPAPPGGAERRLRVPNRLGLHARPAARFVETVARFDADVTVTDETTGRGPADGRSLSALVTLGVRQRHDILLSAGGPQAEAVLAALDELAQANFGDEDGAPPPPAAAEPAAPAAGPPAPGAVLQGAPAASGIAIGPARALHVAPPEVDETPAGDPAAEAARLDAARAAAHKDVQAARERIAQQAGAAEAGIFDAHALLLDDAALLEPARRAISGGASAGAAWRDAGAAAADAYRALDDPYLRERAADVEDVVGRVLGHLGGGAAPPRIDAPGVLVVEDLAPGEAAALDAAVVRGLAVARGGATSHAAILARALGIPSVVGLGDGILAVEEGTPLVVDGDSGTVEVDPPADALAERERARQAAEARRARALARAREPARTRDGVTLEVAANLGAAAEVRGALEHGADGVGLLRTEFLFLDRDEAPTAAEQEAVYEEIAAALDGRPLIVRTLDAGADKPLPFVPQPPEDNPFLGVRGLRLSLANPDLLRDQLRAIVAVAARHPVKVMFPMVTVPAEFRAARALLEEVRREAGAPELEVGVMVEVPALALQAERFAREVDFFSVGTNDLTQYTAAAERGSQQLAALLAGPLPPVLALIASVTAGADAHGRWVGVCGELAGDPGAALLLAGLGVRELSMAPARIPEVKEALRGIELAQAREVARRALELEDADAVREAVAPLLPAT
ncbi:MAG TPA: phosphoenolpyruvate--protein phosphotransferase [Solirubrobacteraceae bacterium]|nr:phosphoenolpyruvate--protein phosphotransferase [Solirubrobacteraceae bacterium]